MRAINPKQQEMAMHRQRKHRYQPQCYRHHQQSHQHRSQSYQHHPQSRKDNPMRVLMMRRTCYAWYVNVRKL